jgi:hypothetical protein
VQALPQTSGRLLDDIVLAVIALLDQPALLVANEAALILRRDRPFVLDFRARSHLGGHVDFGLDFHALNVALRDGRRGERNLHFGLDFGRRSRLGDLVENLLDFVGRLARLQQLLRVAADVGLAQVFQALEAIELAVDVFLGGVDLREAADGAGDVEGDVVNIAVVRD